MKSFKLKKTVLATCFAIGTLVSIPANSSINTELTGFYNNLGGAAIATPPSVAEGQSAYYVSGGNLTSRVPIRNLQLGSIQLPKISAGCGGIDVFGGSFSMINVDEFIQMMKNIGSNAIGFAFQLALDVISPQISGELKDLRNVINAFNSYATNSCEAAQALVGGAMKLTGMQKSYCQAATPRDGTVPDGAAARKFCADDGDANSTLAAQAAKTDAASKDEKLAFSGNLIWEGLKKRGFQPSNQSDRDLMELIMSISGTVIVPLQDQKDADNNPLAIQFPIGGVTFHDFAQGTGAPGVSGSWLVSMLRCDDTDVDSCMTVRAYQAGPGGIKTLRTMTEGYVNSIASKIQNAGNGALTQAELNLIGMVRVPIFSLMQAASDVSPETLEFIKQAVIEYASVELAYSFTSDVFRLAADSVVGSPAGGMEGEKQNFLTRLDGMAEEARVAVIDARNKMGGPYQVTQQINSYRVQAMTRFAPEMQRRIALARKLTIPR